jgi:ssDNA-specific exonuclease RecJ
LTFTVTILDSLETRESNLDALTASFDERVRKKKYLKFDKKHIFNFSGNADQLNKVYKFVITVPKAGD